MTVRMVDSDSFTRPCRGQVVSGDAAVIERRNGENVALISEDELNSLLETAHLLRSPRNARRLAAALERALGGKTVPSSLEQLQQSLGLEEE